MVLANQKITFDNLKAVIKLQWDNYIMAWYNEDLIFSMGESYDEMRIVYQ